MIEGKPPTHQRMRFDMQWALSGPMGTGEGGVGNGLDEDGAFGQGLKCVSVHCATIPGLVSQVVSQVVCHKWCHGPYLPTKLCGPLRPHRGWARPLEDQAQPLQCGWLSGPLVGVLSQVAWKAKADLLNRIARRLGSHPTTIRTGGHDLHRGLHRTPMHRCRIRNITMGNYHVAFVTPERDQAASRQRTRATGGAALGRSHAPPSAADQRSVFAKPDRSAVGNGAARHGIRCAIINPQARPACQTLLAIAWPGT
eukprot:356014-Chlamydomonas_euryale.AAC.3